MSMKIKFLQPTSAIHVLETVLSIVLKIQVEFSADGIADDLLTLGSHLWKLGMYAEAEASNMLTVHFLSRLAAGEHVAAVLPRLIFSLCKLSKRHRRQSCCDLALQTSQQAICLCGLLSGLAPGVDNSAVSLSALIAQAHDLCTIGQFKDAICTAEQATAICRPILAQLFSFSPLDIGTEEISPEDEWRAVKSCEAFFELSRALSLAGNFAAAHRTLKEGLETTIAFAGKVPSPSGSNINMISNDLCRMALAGKLSLSALADMIILYRELSHIYCHKFRLTFLPVLYAHTHFCNSEPSSGTGAPPLHDSNSQCPRDFSILANNCFQTSVMEDAIRAVYASPSLAEAVYPILPLIQHFFKHHFELIHVVL
ncbi:hypothetical protein B0H19DRAFT_1247455 [Mycena capillaripes]|nr:hypothetical protein B0H19DRAFT_1247455 [Mycena capillaripes]